MVPVSLLLNTSAVVCWFKTKEDFSISTFFDLAVGQWILFNFDVDVIESHIHYFSLEVGGQCTSKKQYTVEHHVHTKTLMTFFGHQSDWEISWRPNTIAYTISGSFTAEHAHSECSAYTFPYQTGSQTPSPSIELHVRQHPILGALYSIWHSWMHWARLWPTEQWATLQ